MLLPSAAIIKMLCKHLSRRLLNHFYHISIAMRESLPGSHGVFKASEQVSGLLIEYCQGQFNDEERSSSIVAIEKPLGLPRDCCKVKLSLETYCEEI